MAHPVWQEEEIMWTGAAGERSRRLDGAVLMLFGPTGIIGRSRATALMADAPPWTRATLSDRHAIETDDVVVLAYRVEAWRGETRYLALCSSTWVQRGAAWRMVQHQQTPLTA